MLRYVRYITLTVGSMSHRSRAPVVSISTKHSKQDLVSSGDSENSLRYVSYTVDAGGQCRVGCLEDTGRNKYENRENPNMGMLELWSGFDLPMRHRPALPKRSDF